MYERDRAGFVRFVVPHCNVVCTLQQGGLADKFLSVLDKKVQFECQVYALISLHYRSQLQ